MVPATVQFDRVDRRLVVRLAGEIEQAQTPMLIDDIREQMHHDDDAVLIDVARVTFCGSEGLSMFLHLQSLAQARSTEFALVDPSPIIKAMIAVCGLNDSMRIWTGIAESV